MYGSSSRTLDTSLAEGETVVAAFILDVTNLEVFKFRPLPGVVLAALILSARVLICACVTSALVKGVLEEETPISAFILDVMNLEVFKIGPFSETVEPALLGVVATASMLLVRCVASAEGVGVWTSATKKDECEIDNYYIGSNLFLFHCLFQCSRLVEKVDFLKVIRFSFRVWQ